MYAAATAMVPRGGVGRDWELVVFEPIRARPPEDRDRCIFFPEDLWKELVNNCCSQHGFQLMPRSTSSCCFTVGCESCMRGAEVSKKWANCRDLIYQENRKFA